MLCIQRRIAKRRNCRFGNTFGRDHIPVVETLPNDNYLIRKLQTNFTQILHRMKYRPGAWAQEQDTQQHEPNERLLSHVSDTGSYAQTPNTQTHQQSAMNLLITDEDPLLVT